MAVRARLRVTVFQPVELQGLGPGDPIRGTTRNLSVTGLLASLPVRIAPGELVGLSFFFPGVRTPIQVHGRCVRCAEEANLAGGEEPSFLAAFAFHEMPANLAGSLAQAVQALGLGIVSFLREWEPFGLLEEETLWSLAGAFRMVTLAEGESCKADWDLGHSLILVKSGLVKLFRPGVRQGQERCALGRAGQALGEQALAGGRPHDLRVRALTAAELLLLGPRSRSYLERDAPAVAGALQEMLGRIRERRLETRTTELQPLGLRLALTGP